MTQLVGRLDHLPCCPVPRMIYALNVNILKVAPGCKDIQALSEAECSRVTNSSQANLKALHGLPCVPYPICM